jgi:3-oxoacyl-(acyl-carrier-protein) synthase
LIERDFSDQFSKLGSPWTAEAMLAAGQALKDGGIEQFEGYAQRAGLYYGSVTGGVKSEHDWVRQFHVDKVGSSKPYTIMASMLNAAPALISIKHRILGPVITNSNACSSSGAAIGEACLAIREGRLMWPWWAARKCPIPTFMAWFACARPKSTRGRVTQLPPVLFQAHGTCARRGSIM